MVKNKNSPNQKEKMRNSSHERIEGFINKKEDEKLEKGMEARKDALQKAGMTKQEDTYADHAKIYNYADEVVDPPFKTIDVDSGYNCHWCGRRMAEWKDLCKCDGAVNDHASPREYSSDSAPPSPKLSRKRVPCPSSFKFKQDHRVLQAARNLRAAKVFDKSMAAAGK